MKEIFITKISIAYYYMLILFLNALTLILSMCFTDDIFVIADILLVEMIVEIIGTFIYQCILTRKMNREIHYPNYK